MSEESKKSCWECQFQDLDNDSFLGLCRYFEKRGLSAKEIPPGIVDVGCSHFMPSSSMESGM